jgi:hypothetical protein
MGVDRQIYDADSKQFKPKGATLATILLIVFFTLLHLVSRGLVTSKLWRFGADGCMF